jgi:phosphopantetheinyl transferase (holo-ACP synthase)
VIVPMAPPTTAVAAVALDGHEPVSALAERWLSDDERRHAAGRGDRGRAGHVAGRIAAKQAIGRLIAGAGLPEPDPTAIEVHQDEHGRPVVAVRGGGSVPVFVVSISHTASVAIAIAAPADAAAAGIGIDVEPVEARSHRFERLTLTPAEQLLPPVPGDDRDTWLTRLWAAKEAAAKAGGLGLQGRPKAFEVTDRAGGTIHVAGRWVDTEVVSFGGAAHVVAITPTGPREVPWRSS